MSSSSSSGVSFLNFILRSAQYLSSLFSKHTSLGAFTTLEII